MKPLSEARIRIGTETRKFQDAKAGITPIKSQSGEQ